MSRGITLLQININTGLFLTISKLKHNSHVIKMYNRAYFTQCINYNGDRHGSWIHNYLCNQCYITTNGVGSNPTH